MLTCHAAGRAMRERGHGAILNVSSVASFIANGTYSAEKAFVTVFTEGLAGELAGTGVTATALCPGFTRTEFHARAGILISALPDSLWLDADDVVQQALTDVARGKVVSVPGPSGRSSRSGVRVLPRPLLRGGTLRRLDRFRRPAGGARRRSGPGVAAASAEPPTQSVEQPPRQARRPGLRSNDGSGRRARGAARVPPPPAHRLRRLAGDGAPARAVGARPA